MLTEWNGRTSELRPEESHFVRREMTTLTSFIIAFILFYFFFCCFVFLCEQIVSPLPATIFLNPLWWVHRQPAVSLLKRHRIACKCNDDNIFILFITSTLFFDKSLWGNDVFCQHDYTINNFSSSHHSRPNKRTIRRQYLMEGKNCDDVKKYIYRFHMLQWGTMEKYITSRGARAESGGDHNQKSLGRTKTIMGNFISNFIENVKSAVCDFFLR